MVDRDALDYLKINLGSDPKVQRALGWPQDNAGQVIANWRKRGISLRARASVAALLKEHRAPADMRAAFERVTAQAKEKALAALFGGTTTKRKGKGNGHGGKGNPARQVKRQRGKPQGGKATARQGSRART